MSHITCEIHPGAICYQGGESGNMWICPACELESQRDLIPDELTELRARVAKLEIVVDILVDALRENKDFRPFMLEVLREVGKP